MITRILFVFIGGGLGSIIRYLIGIWFNRNDFLTPFGTFFVNIIGSFLIGILAGYNLRTLNLNHDYQAFLIGGFLGGFTTFSAFTFENLVMLENEKYALFLTYFFSTLILGLFAVTLGYFFSKYI